MQNIIIYISSAPAQQWSTVRLEIGVLIESTLPAFGYITWVMTGRCVRFIPAMQWTSAGTPLCTSRLAEGMSPQRGRCWRGAPIRMLVGRRTRHPSSALLAGGMRVLWRWALMHSRMHADLSRALQNLARQHWPAFQIGKECRSWQPQDGFYLVFIVLIRSAALINALSWTVRHSDDAATLRLCWRAAAR